MVFKLSNTFTAPGGPAGVQQGFPAPGAGGQTTGPYSPPPAPVPWETQRPTKGLFSWLTGGTPRGEQQGMAPPLAGDQRRPPGSMPNRPIAYGLSIPVWTPYYDRGADAWVQNFGKVLTNPIGAGVVALNRPQASYGPAAQYDNGALWWTSQVVPTTINLQGLTDPAELAAILGSVSVQAVVRTTG